MGNDAHKDQPSSPKTYDDLPPETKETLETLHSPIIKALNDEGLTLDKRIKLLVKMTKAKDRKIVKVKGGVKEGEGKKRHKLLVKGGDEDVVEFKVPALQIQHEALRECFKLANDYPATKLEVENDPVVLIYNEPKEEEVKVTPDDVGT